MASAGQTPIVLPFEQPRPIARFSSREADAPQYKHMRELRLQKFLPSISSGSKVALGKPAVRIEGGSKQALMGTNSVESKQQFLLCVDVEQMLKDTRVDPIIATAELQQEVTTVDWLSASTALVSLASGTVGTYSLKIAEKAFVLSSETKDIHDGALREVALQFQSSKALSGGQDRKLCLLDTSSAAPRLVASHQVDGVISSVRWPLFNQNVCPSVTLEDGQFLVFDLRSALSKPVITVALGQQEAYSHDRYTDHHVLIGYGNGEMHHIDMRYLGAQNGPTIATVQDPYVEGIGHMEYNPRNNLFVASGFTDFSVWHNEQSNGEARIWSHSIGNENASSGGSGLAYCAVWFDEQHVLTTTNVGTVGVYEQPSSRP